MEKPKPGWEAFCEHANEVPNYCPCDLSCGCRYYHCKSHLELLENSILMTWPEYYKKLELEEPHLRKFDEELADAICCAVRMANEKYQDILRKKAN